jgi:hypothetical protein
MTPRTLSALLGLGLAVTATACGDPDKDDSSPPEGDADTDTDADADVDEGAVGRFRVEERYDQLLDEASGVLLAWGPTDTPWEADIVGDWSYGCIEKPGDRGIFRVIDTVGECELSILMACDGDCEDNCPSEHYCLGGETCVHEPVVVDVGTIALGGLSQPLELPYGGSMTGSYQPLASPAADLFEPGDAVSITAPGTDHPGFTALLEAPQVLDATLPCDDNPSTTEDLTITWTPSGEEGVRVRWEMLQEYHQAMGPRIRCETDDDGSLTLPASLIEAYTVTTRQLLVLTRFRRERMEPVPGHSVDFELASSVACLVNPGDKPW